MFGARADPHIVEELHGPFGGRLLADAEDELGHHDILQRRELGQEMVELIDETDARPAHRRAGLVFHLSAGAPGHEDITLVRPLQEPGYVQKRRLAGAGRRDQGDHLAGDHVELGILQDDELVRALAEPPMDRIQG